MRLDDVDATQARALGDALEDLRALRRLGMPCALRWSSSSRRLLSIIASSASDGISIGSPNTRATRLNGYGICEASQLGAVQLGLASKWNGTIGLPVTFASHNAPGCATRAGPRGPSSVMPTACPSSIRRLALNAARAACLDVDPRAVV